VTAFTEASRAWNKKEDYRSYPYQFSRVHAAALLQFSLKNLPQTTPKRIEKHTLWVPQG
jgi:hypothetical protein